MFYHFTLVCCSLKMFSSSPKIIIFTFFEIFSVEGSGEVSVVLQNMTWQKAQLYCRQHNMDLASARNQSENQALQQVFSEKGSPALVWIGLFRDKWKWTNQSPSSFRHWLSGQPNNDGDCTLFGINGWWDRSCQHNFPFFCHTGKHICLSQSESTI